MEISGFPYPLVPARPGLAAAVLALLAASALGCAARSGSVSSSGAPYRSELARETIRAAEPRPRPAPDVEARITVGVDHVVGPGQTLWRIARTYGVDLDDLARANGIDDPTRLEAGRVLFVPGALVVREVEPLPERLASGSERPFLPTEPPSEPADATWSWPVQGGEVLSGFGAPRRQRRHRGIDIRGNAGQPVLAARAGRVAYSGSSMRGYGKTVIVDHGDGFSTLYAHNSQLLVRVGQRVERAQAIARVGRTGNATTDHCHFEIRRGDRAVDPLPLLRPALEARR